MKVLHIIKSLGRGGAEMLLPETLKVHNKELFEFHYIYFLPWKNQMVESIEQQGGKVLCIRANNNISLMTKVSAVVSYIKQHNIQLIHAHLPWAGILARFAGRLAKVPVLYTEHNKQERYHWATRKINLLTLNLLTRVIAVSQDVEQSIRKNKATLSVPIETVVNGVNTDKYCRHDFNRSTIRSKFNIPATSPIIGTIAVFRFQKQLDVWMEVAAQALKKIDSLHFIIVGDGPLKEQLYAKRESLGLTNRIHMPGLETEIRPYLACFDIYMMTSVFEGLPIALLEAMAMECPVISTEAGGVKEVIRHGVDGLTCDVSAPEKLADYANDLLLNEEYSEQLGRQARNRIVESFSMNKMVAALEDIYIKTKSTLIEQS